MAEIAAMISKLLDFQKSGHAHASAVKLYNILAASSNGFLDDTIKANPMLKVKRPLLARKKIQNESKKPIPSINSAIFSSAWRTNLSGRHI
ncbi:MAG: hypothetical protein ACLSBB_16135 [Ruthenibacterium lactatiformans]